MNQIKLNDQVIRPNDMSESVLICISSKPHTLTNALSDMSFGLVTWSFNLVQLSLLQVKPPPPPLLLISLCVKVLMINACGLLQQMAYFLYHLLRTYVVQKKGINLASKCNCCTNAHIETQVIWQHFESKMEIHSRTTALQLKIKDWWLIFQCASVGRFGNAKIVIY